jgi:hypothetical protein
MVPPELASWLEARLASGDPVTLESKKESFTGRIFRIMMQEGWIVLEHEDGRRRAFFVTEGGTIRDGSSSMPLGGGAPAGH